MEKSRKKRSRSRERELQKKGTLRVSNSDKTDSGSKLNQTLKQEVSEEKLLEIIMGFSDFDTTKNKSHVDSDLSAVFKGSQVKRKYRQYMNRKGGFNRDLDKVE